MRMRAGFESRDLATAIERQLRNWELAREQRERATPELTAVKPPPPLTEFITVGRSVGCGGSTIAQLLGRRLEWPVFGRQLLQEMAANDSVRERLYRHIDERDMNWVEATLGLLMETASERYEYFHRLCHTILTLARQGPAIFLGRGADLLLPATGGLRVELTAPLQQRIERYAKRHELSHEVAANHVAEQQREREEFVRSFFSRQLANRTPRYDLTINVGQFTAPQAVELILTAYQLTGHSTT